MMFRTKYCPHKRKFTNCGSPIKIEYQLRIVDNHEEIVETGKTNLYEYIQSFADSVDITKILEKCALINDYSLLNRMPTTFMDVSDMPSNLAEAYAAVKDAENYFNHLPLDIKDKYNQNFVEFMSDIGSERFKKNILDFVEKQKKNEEVKEKESNES